jgi:hypothetical protein
MPNPKRIKLKTLVLTVAVPEDAPDHIRETVIENVRTTLDAVAPEGTSYLNAETREMNAEDRDIYAERMGVEVSINDNSVPSQD